MFIMVFKIREPWNVPATRMSYLFSMRTAGGLPHWFLFGHYAILIWGGGGCSKNRPHIPQVNSHTLLVHAYWNHGAFLSPKLEEGTSRVATWQTYKIRPTSDNVDTGSPTLAKRVKEEACRRNDAMWTVPRKVVVQRSFIIGSLMMKYLWSYISI